MRRLCVCCPIIILVIVNTALPLQTLTDCCYVFWESYETHEFTLGKMHSSFGRFGTCSNYSTMRVPSIPQALLQDGVLLHDRPRTVSVLCHFSVSLWILLFSSLPRKFWFFLWILFRCYFNCDGKGGGGIRLIQISSKMVQCCTCGSWNNVGISNSHCENRECVAENIAWRQLHFRASGLVGCDAEYLGLRSSVDQGTLQLHLLPASLSSTRLHGFTCQETVVRSADLTLGTFQRLTINKTVHGN